MRAKKKLESYVPEALEHLGKRMAKYSNSKSQVNLEGLEKAIRTLDREDRERIEKFWGLTGGPNHSKRILHFLLKDVAFEKMREMAILSLGKLLTIDCLVMYDFSVKKKAEVIIQKINKNGLEISDMECLKYLVAFYIYLLNGPKMSFEEDPMSINTEFDDDFVFDEYEMLISIYEKVVTYSDNSINLNMLMDLFEMLDLKEKLIIKKSIGIEIPKSSLPKGLKFEDIETVKSILGVRKLKEKIFPYGAWDLSTALILGIAEEAWLDELMDELYLLQRNWNKISKFKSGEKSLKTMSGIRKFNVYTIKGFEFTDVYEVMFLYLERKLIASKK